jgi:ligand-binding sensor domain-containing protein/signal transduction histidine kinase
MVKYFNSSSVVMKTESVKSIRGQYFTGSFCKSVISAESCSIRISKIDKLKIILPLFLLAACSSAPKDDGTFFPSPLYEQPQIIVANPPGGYSVNQVTGVIIQPIINSLGDTIVTGVPVPARARRMHPDNVVEPIVVQAPSLESLERNNAHPNRFSITGEITAIPLDRSLLKINRIPQVAEGDTTHYMLNSTGQKVRTGVPTPTQGNLVPVVHPIPVNALPSAIKDAATSNLRYLDTDQGLYSSYVFSIHKDTRGKIWFGLEGGVSVYDGQTFLHFTEKHGLSNNRVRSIFEDRKGNIWLGTSGGGVNVYNGESFTHFTEKEGLLSNNVWSIAEDSNGVIWLGTSRGVSLYNGQSFTHLTEKEGLINNNVRSIAEDSKGNVWLGTLGGVSVYDGQSFMHITEDVGLSHRNVRSILVDQQGNIWIGTFGGGLNVYDGESIRHITEAEGLSDNRVRSIVQDSDRNIWVATLRGVSVYDGHSILHLTESEGLSHNRVFPLFADTNGNVWIGTEGGGVAVYDRYSFMHFTTSQGLSTNDVFSIMEDSQGKMWFGTWGGGVSVYDGQSFFHFTQRDGLLDNSVMSMLEDSKGNIWLATSGGISVYDGQSFRQFTRSQGLATNSVYSIMEDSRGNIWLGTREGGVNVYDGQSFIHYTDMDGLSNNTIFAMLEDSEGKIWLGTEGGGVSIFDGESFFHLTEREGLSNNTIEYIFEDSRGYIWLGTWHGVSVYDGHSFMYITENEGLLNNSAWSVLEDTSGNIFVSTEKGLTQLVFNGTARRSTGQGGSLVKRNEAGLGNFKVNNFSKADGLKGVSFISGSAYLDSQNRAWWGVGNSLTMLDLNSYKRSAQNPKPVLKQVDIEGRFVEYRNLSATAARGIDFNNVQRFENYPLELALPYIKNHLTFNFSAIDWAAPHKIKYSFRMLGLDYNWSFPSEETKADYRNLPFGTFIFQFVAIGESGEWSEPFSYTFTIARPWWHRWWAYVLFMLIFLTALRAFSLWRERKLREEKEQLLIKVEERTQQLAANNESLRLANVEIQQQRDEVVKARDSLHKSLEDLKSAQDQLVQQEKLASLGQLTAGIAHEIKNPLNFVNNFSEVSIEMIDEIREELALLGKEIPASPLGSATPSNANSNSLHQTISEILDDIEANLRKIHEHGSRADSIVKSMLMHSRGSDGKMEPTSLNPLVKEYVNLAFHGMRAGKDPINVDIQMDLDETISEIPLIAEDFSRVILNLTNNAFDAMRESEAVHKRDVRSDVRSEVLGVVMAKPSAMQDSGHSSERSDGHDSSEAQDSQAYKPKLIVRTKSEYGQITIEIEDNGPGIPVDIKDKILQPFFTTKKGTQGTGLGLSITHDIIKAHGGSLGINSHPGQTTFTIHLEKMI